MIVIYAKEQFLRFIPVNGVDHNKFYYEHPGSKLPIEVDSSISDQVRIRLIEHLNNFPSLLIHCIVAELDKKYEIVSAELCFQVKKIFYLIFGMKNVIPTAIFYKNLFLY